MKKYDTSKSKEMYEKAMQYLVDGAGSYFHIFSHRKYPIYMTHGKGSKIYDVDGNEYIDYIMGFGPMVMGYSPDAINEAAIKQLEYGSHFAAPTPDLINLSQKLTEIIPCAEAVSYQNSGTEVVMQAMRLARAYTDKYKIIKFEGHYHGWSDEEKVSIDADNVAQMGDRNNPTKIIHTKGQRLSSADDLIVLPWNDLGALKAVLEKQANEIAAVLMEPCMFDSGPIMPLPGYLEGVRELTKKHHVVLIFDEVITGFRMALGGAQEYYGVTPDMATFAKALACGYPFGAIVGKKEIMNCGIHASGTFNGNALGVAASLRAIEELSKPGVYERIDELGQMLEDGFKSLAQKYNIKIYTKHTGAIFSLYFGFDREMKDFREWLENADTEFYKNFIAKCEQYGVRFMDRRGREYLSTAHTKEDIRKTLEVADHALMELLTW